nr:MAG: putative capsid protein [Polycipiviridae sp. XZN141292]
MLKKFCGLYQFDFYFPEMEQPVESQKKEISSRAKEIDTGPIPLSMENVILGLPFKPGPVVDNLGSVLANSWNISEYVGQRKLRALIDVTTSSSNSEPLWQYTHSWKNVVQDHFRKFSSVFSLWSWKLNFHFEFRSNFQQVGMLLVSYTNFPSETRRYFYPDKVFNQFVVQTQFPHRMIMMGEDNDLLVGLTWLSPYKAAPSEQVYSVPGGDAFNDYDMGTIFLWAPFQMMLAPGVTANSMTVRIWSYLTDVKYSGYSPDDDDP